MEFIKVYMMLDGYTKKLVDSIHRRRRVEQRHQLEQIKKNMKRLKIDDTYIEKFIEEIKVVCDF